MAGSDEPESPATRSYTRQTDSEADVKSTGDVIGSDESSSTKLTCAKVWRDPKYFRWITTLVMAIGGAFTFGIIGDFSMFNIYLERDMNASIMQLSKIMFSLTRFCVICENYTKNIRVRLTR